MVDANFWLKELKRWQKIDSKPLDVCSGTQVQFRASAKCAAVNRYYLHGEASQIYLTQREMEVAALLVRGLNYKRIANQLKIGCRTIECYVKSIRLKLGCRRKNELVPILAETTAVKNFKYP